MTPNVVEMSAAAPNQLSRAKMLAKLLLSQRGEASGAAIACELHGVLHKLAVEDRRKFQQFLAAEFTPDETVLRAAAESYLSQPSAAAAALLAQAADPPRQEVLRRMNMAPGGTNALVAMRKEIAGRLRDQPTLRLLESDLKHLFASWFNRGFLELRRVDWQSPAAVLEKLIAYEAVHEIRGWDDLRRGDSDGAVTCVHTRITHHLAHRRCEPFSCLWAYVHGFQVREIMSNYFEMAKSLNLDDRKVNVVHGKYRGAQVAMLIGWPEAREALMGHIPYKHRLAYATGYDGPNFGLPVPVEISDISRPDGRRLCSRARPRMRPGDRSRVSMPSPRKTGRSVPISNASWPSA